MRRITLALAALLLAGSVVLAQEPGSAGVGAKPVVVDPLDLRPPVADPEAGLTQKYDSKLVRFTGILRASGLDAQQKRWHDLRTDVPLPASAGPAKKGATARKAPVTVRVYLHTDDPRLRTQRGRVPLTVEGTGEITVDGTLVIHAGRLVRVEAGAKR
ncbi:MAG: hypothetical protein L0Z62_42870 [Gemmataceae bacterium]|nr:hypothetical protein [Gemmataceae bacterium]